MGSRWRLLCVFSCLVVLDAGAAAAGPKVVPRAKKAEAPAPAKKAAAQAPAKKGRAAAGPKVVPRFGLLLGGSGEGSSECDGSGCRDDWDPDPDPSEDESGLGVGVTLLGPVTDSIHLGGDLFFVPGVEHDPDDEDDEIKKWGSDLSVLGVGEFRVLRSQSVDLFARAGVGFIVLFPDDDLEREIVAGKDYCEEKGLYCSVDEGPFIGLTLGGGAGVSVGFEGFRLRVELMLQWLDQPVFEAKIADGRITLDYAGTRDWLVTGIELGD